MRARSVVAVVVAVVLLVAGGLWWSQRSGDVPAADPPSAPQEGPRPSTSPGPTENPSAAEPVDEEALGRPVTDCSPTGGDPGRLPGTFWGMHAMSPIGSGFPDAPLTAINLTTSGTYWNQVETAPGRYDFARLDAIVTTAQQRGARPMVVMGFTPSFHAADPGSATARTTMPDEGAWRAWADALVRRYGARLDYQVWPEPNIVSNWSGTPAQMARLTVLAAEVIHDRAPRARVVAPAVALRLPSQRRWMAEFWATEVAGTPVGDVVDAVALDPFPLERGGPEESVDLVCEARAILRDHGVDAPLWTNEINYGVPSGGHATDVQPYPASRQAAAVARTYVLHAAEGADRVYWLGWFESPGMAVVLARDGVRTGAGQAYEVVNGWLAGRSRPRCGERAGLHTCVVRGDRLTWRLLWHDRGSATVRAGSESLRLETLDGRSREVGPGTPVRVGEAPVAVVERRPG